MLSRLNQKGKHEHYKTDFIFSMPQSMQIAQASAALGHHLSQDMAVLK
jgi:hypothetical protein